MKKKEKLLLATRVDYLNTLMSDDDIIKKQIEKGFKLFLKNNNIKPDTNGLYYDKKRKINITPAIWAAIYYGLEKNKTDSDFDPANTLFDGTTLSEIITEGNIGAI